MNQAWAGLPVKIYLLQLRSWDALADFDDRSVDIAFVDGDHRYRAVLTDMEDWWPKLRDRGIMLGDDYGNGFQ